MTITVTVPKDDLVACAEAGNMLLAIARQKARTPDNESYVAEAQRYAVKQADVERKHECACKQTDGPIPAPQTTAYGPAMCEVIDPIDGMVDIAIDAGAAFNGAPLQVVNTAPFTGGVPQAPIVHAPVEPIIDRRGVVAAGVELDSRGLPWDYRIHGKAKNKCVDGIWKNIKGVDKDLLVQVEAELGAAMAGSSVAVAPQAVIPTVPVAPVGVPPAPIAGLSPVPTPTPTTATVPIGCPASFPEFLQIVTAKCSARTLTFDEVTKTCQAHGLAGIPLLNARLDLMPTIYAELEAIWLTRS
jgi:hypothetical protein